MARLKHTARRTDDKGQLPPLACPKRNPMDWGTAKKTFLRHVLLPEVQKEGARPGVKRLSYKGKYSTLNRVERSFIRHVLQCTVQYTEQGRKSRKKLHTACVTVYSTVCCTVSKESKEQTLKRAVHQIHHTCSCNA